MHRALSSCYHVEYLLQREMDAAPDRGRSGKSNPWLQTQYCNENKTHQHSSSQFSSVCLL